MWISRGGIFEKILKVLSTFFLDRPNCYTELSQTTIKTINRPNFLRAAGEFLKKGKKKSVFMHFLIKNVDQKLRFFGANSPPPLKTCIYWRQRQIKFWESVSQNINLKIVQRGDPLGRQGVKSLKGGRPPPTPLPKSDTE